MIALQSKYIWATEISLWPFVGWVPVGFTVLHYVMDAVYKLAWKSFRYGQLLATGKTTDRTSFLPLFAHPGRTAALYCN